MKKIILKICLFIITFPFASHSQNIVESGKPSGLKNYFLNIGLGGSNTSRVFTFGTNFIYANKWGFSISYNKHSSLAAIRTPEFENASCSIKSCDAPTDNLSSHSFRILRIFPTKSKFVRFGIEGGFSFIFYKANQIVEVNNAYSYRPSGGSGLFNLNFILFGSSSSNNNYPYTTASGNPIPINSNYDNTSLSLPSEKTIGASFRVKAEFPVSRFAGIEIAAISNINKYKSYVAAEVNLTIGLIRGK